MAVAIGCKPSALAGSDFRRPGDRQPELVWWIFRATRRQNRAGDVFALWHLITPTFTDFQSDG